MGSFGSMAMALPREDCIAWDASVIYRGAMDLAASLDLYQEREGGSAMSRGENHA
jgi:hypothetical protein